MVKVFDAVVGVREERNKRSNAPYVVYRCGYCSKEYSGGKMIRHLVQKHGFVTTDDAKSLVDYAFYEYERKGE